MMRLTTIHPDTKWIMVDKCWCLSGWTTTSSATSQHLKNRARTPEADRGSLERWNSSVAESATKMGPFRMPQNPWFTSTNHDSPGCINHRRCWWSKLAPRASLWLGCSRDHPGEGLPRRVTEQPGFCCRHFANMGHSSAKVLRNISPNTETCWKRRRPRNTETDFCQHDLFTWFVGISSSK